MSSYLVASHRAATPPASVGEHLPTARPRRYPSDTSDIDAVSSHCPGGTGIDELDEHRPASAIPLNAAGPPWSFVLCGRG